MKSDESPRFGHPLTMAHPLTTLPDLCLLRILDYLPLSSLSHLPDVHSRFASLLSECLLRRRQHLTLLIGDCTPTALSDPNQSNLPRTEFITNDQGIPIESGIIYLDTNNPNHSLSVPELSPEIIDHIFTQIDSHLGRIRSLQVILNQIALSSLSAHLFTLLLYLAPNLTRLHLHFGSIRKCSKDCCTDALSHKLAVFNELFSKLTPCQFPALSYLTITYRGLLCDQSHPRIELPILPQLTEFTFEVGENLVKSLDLVNRLRGNHLRRIVLANRIFFKDNIKSYWLDVPATLARSFTYLEVYQYDSHFTLFTSLIEIFCNLQVLSLSLSLATFPILQLSASLAPLSKLNYLRLTMYFDGDQEPVGELSHDVALQQVKILVLKFEDDQRHHSWECMKMHRVVPSLQILKFVLTKNCPGKTEAACARELAQGFIENCLSLRKVESRDIQVWKRICI